MVTFVGCGGGDGLRCWPLLVVAWDLGPVCR